MTTTTSFFKPGRLPGLYAAALRRNIPFVITSGILLFAAIVLPYIVNAPDHMRVYDLAITGDAARISENLRLYYTGQFQHGIYLGVGQTGVVAYILAGMSFASALVANRYLHSQKMTDLYHALPVRRGQLFVSNMLGSLSALLLPYTVLYAGTAAGQLAVYGKYGCFGAAHAQYIAGNFLLTVLFVIVVYLFTSFIAVNVGTTFDALLIAGSLSVVPSILYFALGSLWQTFRYGAYFSARHALALSPTLFFMDTYTRANEQYVGVQGGWDYWLYLPDHKGNAVLFAVWLVVAALLFAATLFCYRRRRSEIAGQTQATGVCQTVCKCAGAFCGSLVMLAIFFVRGPVVIVIAMLFGAVAAGVIAELVLSRTPQFLGKNLKWLVGSGALCCLVVFGLRLDILGYSQKIPDIAGVASVEINYAGRNENNVRVMGYNQRYNHYMYEYGANLLTDPEAIAVVLQAHLDAVSDQPPGARDWYRTDHASYPYVYTRITYTMSDGKTFSRSFGQMNTGSYLSLAALEANGDYIRKTNPLFVLDDALAAQENYVSGISFVDVLGNEHKLGLSTGEIRALIDAMQQDLLDESLAGITDPAGAPLGFVKVGYLRVLNELDIWLDTEDGAAWVQVTGEYADTLALLEGHGVNLTPPDSAAIEACYLFAPYEYANWHGYYTCTLVPGWTAFNNSPLYSYVQGHYDDAESHYIRLDGAADIRAVYNAGVNQLLLSPENLDTTMIAVYDIGGGNYAMQFVRADDLPAQAREEAAALAAREASNHGYVIYVDAPRADTDAIAVAEETVTVVAD